MSRVFKNRINLHYWCFGALFFAGSAFAEKKTESAPEPLPLAELRAFTEAYYQIKSSYVEDVDDVTLIRSAIAGMVNNLDNHSRFLEPREFEQFNTDNLGEYAGIGVSLNDHKFGFEVAQVIKNSPASRAGIQPGMIVTHIDQEPIRFMSSEDAQSKLKGEAGSAIELVVSGVGIAKPQTIQLTREIVLLESVSSGDLPGKTGYIAISQFTLNSVNEFKSAMLNLSKPTGLDNLIIDLRDNPGGYMEVAVELSDLFVDQGKLLIASGRAEDANEIYFAHDFAPYGDLNVVVVINSGSASASEIMAAALQDHQKATILGENSYGKGSIQTVIPLNQESGMKLTTAEYFSPKGYKIQDVGIIPDVEFEVSPPKNTYNVSLLDDPELLQAYNLVNKK